MTLQERISANAAAPNGLDIILGGALLGQEHVQQLPTSRLHPKENHSFRIRQDTEYFAALRESIKAGGVKTPLLVRPHPGIAGDYEIIAGHTRHTVCELEGILSLPCVVRQMSDAEADRLMAESNIQRPDWLPSERARTFAVWLEAVRQESGIRERQRTDLTAGTEFPQTRNRDLAARKWGISGKAFDMYCKLNDLIPPLLDLVDSGRIGVKVGYHLAFLPKEKQERVKAILSSPHIKLNESAAQALREFDEDDWWLIFGGKTPKKSVWKFEIPREAFSSLPEKQVKAHLKDEQLQRLIAETINRYLAAQEGGDV